MKKLPLLYVVFLSFITSVVHAQDTLPKFSARNVGNNRIIIGWVNQFESIRQISIQRSFDSLSGFKTILTVPDPTTLENGYVDTKANNDRMFYRLYIMLDKGIYLFSESKKPFKDTIRSVDPKTIPVILQGGDTLVAIKRFPGSDSVNGPVVGNNNPRPNAFTPSLYVYTHRDGYVRINLPDNEKPKKYSLKFYDNDHNLLFELKEVNEKSFKIDKTNFYRAGWFRFELFEDGALFEAHKFYLDKEF